MVTPSLNSLFNNFTPDSKMNTTTDNIIDRDELQQHLIDHILDDMDLKTLMQLVADQLDNNYDQYTVDELIEETKEYYPHLLD